MNTNFLNIRGLLEQIKNGHPYKDAKVVKDYYSESYAKIVINDIKLVAHINNRWVHGSTSPDDFVVSEYITITYPNGHVETLGGLKEEAEYIVELVEKSESDNPIVELAKAMSKTLNHESCDLQKIDKWLFRDKDWGLANNVTML